MYLRIYFIDGLNIPGWEWSLDCTNGDRPSGVSFKEITDFNMLHSACILHQVSIVPIKLIGIVNYNHHQCYYRLDQWITDTTLWLGTFW